MVNVPGRSKGCSTCRRRKIKCDESFPECLKCVKTGLQCPGPRTGAFFVYALPDRPSSRLIAAKHKQVDLRPQAIGSQKDREAFDSILYPSLSLIQQPGRADIFDQLFVSHFIESFSFKAPVAENSPPTWLDELAVFLASPVPGLVRHSIRAGSMFFYGTLVHDVSIQTEACRWYLRALQGLQGLLSQNASSFTGDVVCAVVMLTHFENLAGTSEGAWFQHVQGAAMMLEAGGPESCRVGFLHELFRHLRLLTFVASIFKNEEHVFSSPQWMTIPFEVHSKGAFDQLVDILFFLLPCLTIADKLVQSHGEKADTLRGKLNTLILSLIFQLHLWWKGCISMANLGEINGEIEMKVASNGSDNVPWDPSHFPTLDHSDMPTAALAALYDAANIIAFRLLFLVSPSAPLYEERIQRHAQSILSAKKFVSAIPGPASNRGSLMVDFPFRILNVWSPPRHGGKNRNGDASGLSATPDGLFASVASYVLCRKSE